MKLLIAAIGVALLSSAAWAQTAPALPPPGEGFNYEPAGRRDPFLNLLATGVDTALPDQRPDGPAGLATSEISVRGVVNSRGALVAVVQGADNKTHILRQGDTLMDGRVKAVTAEGLVILQAVNDPLSLVKEREVTRLLRSAPGDTKE